MYLPQDLHQFDTRQNNNSTDSKNKDPGPGQKKTNVFIVVAAVIVFTFGVLLLSYFALRTLRRMNCRPKYIPGKFLKEKWNRWGGASYGQVPNESTANRNDHGTSSSTPAEEGSEMNTNATVHRETSVRSVITLPAYSPSPKPTEQVIAREGERGGMDVVVEFPETAEEEEARREELMESLYQIRQERRREIAEREARRRERREARAQGDFVRLEQLRLQSRARARSRSSANGSTSNMGSTVALAEHQSRGRDRRISSVSYAELGYVRHDGSRMRVSSTDSDRHPLLSDAGAVSTDNPNRSSTATLTNIHSRGESYSSVQSAASGVSETDGLTRVRSDAPSAHSAGPSLSEPEEGDVGAHHIPPPSYDNLDWGEAPPYESPVADRGEQVPRLRELTALPTIHVDAASPISNAPPSPTIPQHADHDASSRWASNPSSTSPSSFASFGSDFDPEHEALASTREIEGSPRLPAMKTNARKQNHNSDQEDPDYAINSSMLERYFPEFSQIGTSEEEGDHGDDEFSIELGRGPTKPTRRLDDSRNSYISVENSVRSSSPAVRLDYPTSNTPPKSAMRNTSRRAVSENLRKDAQLRQASLAHKENIDPHSKPNRRDQRRTLSEMHAKVRDSYDGSFLGDERPAAAANNTRATRFGNANLHHQVVDAVERASQEAYAREMRRGKSSRNVSAAGDTGTQQSFLLPDLPNLSELVSGVYEDGTPVFSRQNRARATRFVSPPHDTADVSVTREHMPLDAVPIPEDEKALFVSLRLLQDKVSELERGKADAERKIEEIKHENATLRSGKTRKDKHGRTKYEERDSYRENQKFIDDNLALQNQLDIYERKAHIQEAALKKLNRERDMAVSQLGVAYLETQDLKAENQDLRAEIAELKAQLTKLASLPSKNREDTLESEQSSATEGSTQDSRTNTRRTGNTSRETRELTKKRSRSKCGRREDSRAMVSNQVDREISRLEKERAEEELFSIDLPRSKGPSTLRSEKPEPRSQTRKSNTGKQRVKRVVVEEVDVTEPVESTAEATGNTRKSSGSEKDVTLLSFVDEHEIAQLRKTLEEERLSRKRRVSNTTRDNTAIEPENSTRRSTTKMALPRKSSLKETKEIPSRPASAMGDLTTTSKTNASENDESLSVPIVRQRRHSDHSATSRRRRNAVEDMTSAFILPDITLHHADAVAEDPSRLPESAQRALDSATQHNGKNCTVCKRSVPGGTCDHTRENVKVPKPVPVSERMPEPSSYNEDPTLRPAQPPAVALASVLKALEDELSHLKMQLVTYQGVYNKLDASLSKRQRKSLGAKIEKILKSVDMKADQIYALYDVLEGQKQNGHEMTEQEMEMTLQSIGIDAGANRTADVTATTDRSSQKKAEYEDDDEDLPWEGIESTMDMTGRSIHCVFPEVRYTRDPLEHRPNRDHYGDTDGDSVDTAIYEGDSGPCRTLAPAPVISGNHRPLSVNTPSDSDSDDDETSDDEGAPESASEKPVTWASLPKKGQLAILTFARLSEPLTQTSLQAYMFYQLRSFNPSLPDSTISAQAGILQGCFTAAQFLTAVWWGRLADAEWMGRKRVLMIGLLGTCLSCLGFGFSRSFAVAVVFRTFGGILNSNVGVMRTMIAEIIQEKKYQSRAFLLLPMCFNIGVIIGPVLGGMLADPIKNYPHLFGPGSVFGGEDGVGWMQRWPFALPNLLSAIFIFASLMAVFLGLEETHEVARYRHDWGRKLGRVLAKNLSRRRVPRYYRPLISDADDESLYIDSSVGSRSLPPSPARVRARPHHKRPSFRQVWTTNVLLTLLAHFLLAFHTSAFNAMTFVFLSAPRAPEGSQHGIHFGGGLGLPSSRVGLATAIIGVIGLPLQILVYPQVQSRLGTLTSFRTFLPFSPMAYALMPFLVLIPRYPWLVWPAFTVVVGLQVISRAFSLPAAIILVNNSVTDASVLGTIHGVAQSISSGARTLGPFIGGWGLGLGFKENLVGGIWWFLALEALVGWLLLWRIYEGGGIEKRPEPTEDEEE
ncbi:hypothetical protein BDV59DRAFT_196861 [Aspergillus ambiguus]|uniref:uncharacterized protein n=1 Tax=Aspergillus ambiguus TaxID=176160 RepID=UPI003CCD360B